MKEALKEISPIELLPGQEFKVEGWRNFRTVINVRELTEHDHIFPFGRKVLIMHDNCKQLTILKDRTVLIK